MGQNNIQKQNAKNTQSKPGRGKKKKRQGGRGISIILKSLVLWGGSKGQAKTPRKPQSVRSNLTGFKKPTDASDNNKTFKKDKSLKNKKFKKQKL